MTPLTDVATTLDEGSPMIEWERHPIFAAFVARVLEQALELREGTLTYHTDQDLRARRAGWTYRPASPLVEVVR